MPVPIRLGTERVLRRWWREEDVVRGLQVLEGPSVTAAAGLFGG
jgi:hypothetical protein